MINHFEKFNLTNKTAVVTGASEGIGRDIAIGLAEAGANIVVCSRREEKLIQVKKVIEKMGSNAFVFPLDIQDLSKIKELKQFINDNVGDVDILINNAGYAVTKSAWDISENEFDLMMDIGFKGLFFCCQAVGSIMREQGYGKIINISSTFSKSIVPGRSIYAGIKAGIDHLTEALAMEWASHGIRVNALAPTAVKTPSRKETLSGEILEKVLARIPLGRLATPDDLIGAIIFLASEASDFVTGQTLFVDGGWVAAS